MAVPAEFTTLDISGKFVMNKSLSDSTDEILRLQGIGWFKRKIIAAGTLYLTIKHYKDDNGVERIDIDQTLSPGGMGTREERILDWSERNKDDGLFGAVVGRSRRVTVEEIEDDYLKNGWDSTDNGFIQSYVSSDTPKSGTSWIANQIWGVEEIDSARRYVRHVFFTGPQGEEIRGRLVYDYAGSL
ncbi:hypothetical protein EV361DRAFT_898398 [Lentinula raphanica]|uniref:Lccl domain-containing protein n=1 Tax=Lentinula raphanica TaxID=153919 RepID=A0AA38U7K3_9AGAR|nr:hypothetical protein F5880DRAFT_1520206 [Lentinula raphanica]KAJ3833641.1 hypothetical protein F5878DRAFT_665482 [Lentinula raphanica]KAJ3973742.1 hypothetical protein EV361DRAFT_898398 [Lentinula raphanica]